MNTVVRLAVLAVLCVALAGCQLLEREKSDKPSVDWSRGLWVGEAYLSTPVGMAVAPDGGRVHLAWSARSDETRVIHYRQLDEMAATLVDVDLDLQPGAYKPQLVLDGEENLHILWLAPLEGVRALYHGLLGSDGRLQGESTLLSDQGDNVESFLALANPPRGVEVFWTVEGKGLQHVGLSPDGRPLGDPMTVEPETIVFHAQRDREGRIHLIWDTVQAGMAHDISYAVYDPAMGTLGPAAPIVHFAEGTGDVVRGPFLGLDPAYGYILWSIEHRGQASGTAEAWYAAFPLEAPGPAEAHAFRLPMTTDAVYEPVSGAPLDEFGLRRPYSQLPRAVETQAHWRNVIRLPVERMRVGSDWVETPMPAPGQHPVLLLSATLRVQERLERQVQPIELFMGPQGPMGYAMAGLTDSVSLYPQLRLDDQGHSHLTWLDTAGFGRFRVYYATTAPAAKAVLDTITPEDMAVRSLDLAWGVIASLAFTPIAIIWALPPLFWLAIFYLTTAEDNLSMPRTKGAFVVAIFLYAVGKFACLPRYLLFVPFYERVPVEWTGAWVTAVPLMILGTAVGITLLFLRHRDTRSLFVATAMTILVDAVLTILIYTPGFLGLI